MWREKLRLRSPCKKCIVRVTCTKGCTPFFEHANLWIYIKHTFKCLFRVIYLAVVYVSACCLIYFVILYICGHVLSTSYNLFIIFLSFVVAPYLYSTVKEKW